MSHPVAAVIRNNSIGLALAPARYGMLETISISIQVLLLLVIVKLAREPVINTDPPLFQNGARTSPPLDQVIGRH